MKYTFFVSLFYNCPCLVKGEASFSVFVKKKTSNPRAKLVIDECYHERSQKSAA